MTSSADDAIDLTIEQRAATKLAKEVTKQNDAAFLRIFGIDLDNIPNDDPQLEQGGANDKVEE